MIAKDTTQATPIREEISAGLIDDLRVVSGHKKKG